VLARYCKEQTSGVHLVISSGGCTPIAAKYKENRHSSGSSKNDKGGNEHWLRMVAIGVDLTASRRTSAPRRIYSTTSN
jgi:hypothetical protein